MRCLARIGSDAFSGATTHRVPGTVTTPNGTLGKDLTITITIIGTTITTTVTSTAAAAISTASTVQIQRAEK